MVTAGSRTAGHSEIYLEGGMKNSLSVNQNILLMFEIPKMNNKLEWNGLKIYVGLTKDYVEENKASWVRMTKIMINAELSVLENPWIW